MSTWMAYTIAAVSTTALIALWFWVARRELYAKQSMVEAAERQFTASRNEYNRVKDGPEQAKAQEILKRSQSVYRQAIGIFNSTLRKPWNAIPALFLGFRQKSEDYTGQA